MIMGLNLRSESESAPYFSKELRYQLWWALSMLDTILCEMTGHPLSIKKNFCTTPLPGKIGTMLSEGLGCIRRCEIKFSWVLLLPETLVRLPGSKQELLGPKHIFAY